MIIGLSAYRIRIKEPRAKEWWQIQRNSNQDAYAEFDNYLQRRHNLLVRLGDPDGKGNYKDQRALMLTKIVRSEEQRMLACLFYKGEAGIMREIRNFDKPEGNPVYQTAINEGILTPLYCRIHFQDGLRYGIILMQTMGLDGIKGYLDCDFRRYFKNEVGQNKRKVEMVQLLDRQVLEEFATHGSLHDIILVNYGATQRSKDAMSRNTVAGERLGQDGDRIEMRLARKEGFSLQTIRKFLSTIRNRLNPETLLNINGMGEYDDLKVEIKLGGRKQVFSLIRPDDSPIRIDITNQIRFGKGNLPTWDSIHAAADAAWQDINTMINGGA